MRCTHRYHLLAFLVSGLFSFQVVFPVTIGSDTVVSRDDFMTLNGTNNEILGFAALENGFALEDNTTTCTFNAFFPVSGSVILNGGTLYLEQDLVLSNVVTLTSLGNVYGAAHSFEFATNLSELGSVSATVFNFDNVELVLNSNITLYSNLSFSGDCVINGQGNCLTLNPESTIVLDDDSTLCFKDVCVKGVNGDIIRGSNENSCFEFKDIELFLDGDYTFSLGKFNVTRDFHVFGEDYIFAYQTDQQSSIGVCGRMFLDNNVTFSYDPSAADSDLLQLAADTSELHLIGATLHTTTTALRLTKGRFIIDRSSCLSSEINNESGAIKFGDGSNAANNLDIQIKPAAKLRTKQGFVVIDNV